MNNSKKLFSLHGDRLSRLKMYSRIPDLEVQAGHQIQGLPFPPWHRPAQDVRNLQGILADLWGLRGTDRQLQAPASSWIHFICTAETVFNHRRHKSTIAV